MMEEFLLLCFKNESLRPSASDLQNHQWIMHLKVQETPPSVEVNHIQQKKNTFGKNGQVSIITTRID